MTVTGAAMVCATLPSARQGLSRALAAADLTKTKRPCCRFDEVGPTGKIVDRAQRRILDRTILPFARCFRASRKMRSRSAEVKVAGIVVAGDHRDLGTVGQVGRIEGAQIVVADDPA